MKSSVPRTPRLLGLVVFPVMAASVSGCATVKPEELDSRLEDLRAEMRQEMESRDEEMVQELNGRMDQMEERVQALEADLNALERDFDATVERLEAAVRFNLPIYFGFDESEIRSQDGPILDRFAQVIRKYFPNSLITVEGFTDPAGSQEYNQWLGEQRAQAVISYLTENTQLSSRMLRMVSYGESVTRQVNRGQSGPGVEGMENRRVVLVVDHTGQGPER